MAKKSQKSPWSTEDSQPEVEVAPVQEPSELKTYRMRRDVQVNQLTFLEGHDYEVSPELAETLRSFGAI